ncbi:HEPN domain-containing protein [Candidatus Sumerlaeota bacterium]|nr:HEPN domain-containing protein [Candidatus Sumerlaeota bacterium]
MTESKHGLVQAWLIKASRDLASARTLAYAENPLLDTAIYHCQQAAEKAVKGFLVFHDIRFEKIHLVGKLVALAATVVPQFAAYEERAEFLTPFATTFRYPGEALDVAFDEFEEALQNAEDLYAFVLSLLPKEVRP